MNSSVMRVLSTDNPDVARAGQGRYLSYHPWETCAHIGFDQCPAIQQTAGMAQDIDWEKGTISNPAGSEPDWESGTISEPNKPRTRGLFEAVNDNVIEFANAAAGGVSALANMVKPGNAVSSFIDENIIKSGEQKQSDVVQGAKRQLSEGLQSAQGIGDEVGAVGSYVLNNPLLAASQAAGSFALPGGAVKGAGAAAKALGAGAKGIETAGRVGGIAAGAAMAGGDAAGTAFDLASKAGATEDQALAAGRQASVIPALVGGVTGAFGAERLLAGAKGFGGNALSRGLKSGLSEAGQEALEEGVTQFEGQRAAMPYDSTIDPTKGVAGAAAMGGIMGFGPGAVLGAMGEGPKPSQQMGIDPNAGPLSRAAATSVDSQAVQPSAPVIVEPQPLGPVSSGQVRKTYAEASKDWVANGKRGDVIRDGGGFRFAAEGTPELDAWKSRFAAKQPEQASASEEAQVVAYPAVAPAPAIAEPEKAADDAKSVYGNSGDVGVSGASKAQQQVPSSESVKTATKVNPSSVLRDMAEQFRERFKTTQKETDRTFAVVLDEFAADIESGKRDPATVESMKQRYAEILATPATKKEPVSVTAPVEAEQASEEEPQAPAPRTNKLKEARNARRAADELRGTRNSSGGAGADIADAGVANDVGSPGGTTGATAPVVPKQGQPGAGERPTADQASLTKADVPETRFGNIESAKAALREALAEVDRVNDVWRQLYRDGVAYILGDGPSRKVAPNAPQDIKDRFEAFKKAKVAASRNYDAAAAAVNALTPKKERPVEPAKPEPVSQQEPATKPRQLNGSDTQKAKALFTRPAGSTPRPDNWRGNAIKAGKVARSLGLDPKGKRLKEIVAEIDAVDAGSGVAAKPVSREQAIRDAWRKEPRTIGKWTPISVEAEGQKADMLVNQKRAGGDKDGALHVVNIRMGKMLKDMEREPIAYTFRLTSDNRLVEEGIPTVATPGQIAAWKGAGFALDYKPANVQNTPSSTAGAEAKASPVEARAPEGGNAASDTGVPAAPGAGDVQADGVKADQSKQEADENDDGIRVKEGKGGAKGMYFAIVDGESAPGGPWATPDIAQAAGEEWKRKTIQNAKDTKQERDRWNAIAESFKAGKEVTTAQIESLGLKAGTSDVRWFFPIAARLFDITSRDIRPLVKGLIRDSFTDMGAKREFVPTRKALEAVAADVVAGEKKAESTIKPSEMYRRLQQLSARANRKPYTPLTEEEFKAVVDAGLATGKKWATGKLNTEGYGRLAQLEADETNSSNARADAEDLIAEGLPFKASAVDQYGLAVPEGYVRQGEMFAKAAPAAQTEPDYLKELFGVDAKAIDADPFAVLASAAEKSADQKAKDIDRIRESIKTEAARAKADYDDWAGRVYKRNQTQVDLRGDGPSNQASMSVGAINESRRRNAMEALSKELAELEKLEKAVATDEGAERVIGRLNILMGMAQKAVDSRTATFKTVDEQFQYMLLDSLEFRGPGGKGNITSNGLSKAMLAAVKPAAQAEKPAEPYDAARAQELRNSIAEGELILSSGKSNGKRLTAQQLEAVRKSVDSSRAKLDSLGEDDAFMGDKAKAKRQGTPVDRAIMDMAGEGREANEILSFIAKTSKSPYRRQLAQKLLATGANPAVSLGGEMGGGAGFRFLAKYSRKNHEVTLSGAAADRAEQIFLHETTHAATLLALDKGGLIATQMRRLAANVYKDASPEMRKMYGLVLDKRTGEVNVGEFVAEAFTNPDFQKALKGMKADNGSLWDRLVNIVRRILGMEPRQQDALSKALELGAGVMRENMPLRAAKSFRAEDAYLGAWHGSPHKFDKFTTDKIGAGEGNQAYGWGLYFASKKEIAEHYRKTLTARDEVDLWTPELRAQLSPSLTNVERQELNNLSNEMWKKGSLPAERMAEWRRLKDKDSAHKESVERLRPNGRLYKVDIPEEETMLMWDRPLSEQPASILTAVRRAHKAVGLKNSHYDLSALSGSNVYDGLTRHLGSDKAASESLLSAGIRGIKYLDGTSRSAGKGSYNYVVFSGDDVSITDTEYFGIADAVEQIGKQAAVKPVVQALNDTFKVRGKIHWWHKTVGTPFNLAERVPEFKRVFNSVQDFINSVSFYGAEAAAMAPKIIPKLESWKDLGKSPIKAEDNKAIATPIFEGTLSWRRGKNGTPVRTDDVGDAGIVWSDDELRSMFKLNDEQIGLYREFRAATDKSLTDLALSDILQFAGKDAEPIKDTVMGMSLKEGSETVSRYLKSLADGEDKVRKAMLFDTVNSIKEKADKAQSLMDRGYAPLQRFGRHTLYATNDKGEQLFFGMYEDRWAAARAARQMREQYPGAKVEVGMMSEQSYKLFQGISPETLELFGTMLGLDPQADGKTNEAFQTYLKLAKSNRSALKRLIERKGISGYSEDASRVLASFIYSNARQTASNLHVGEIMNGVNDIPRDMGEAKDAAVKLARYTMDPQEEAQALRGLLFAQYLGGSIASAAINALQPAQVTFPYLSQFVGAKKSASLMTGAVRDAIKKSTGDPKLDAELRKAEEEGIVSPQEIFQLMAQAQGKATLKAGDGTKAGDAMAAASNTLSRLSLGWGKVFSIPEQFNRRTTFIAAYRTAKETGEANPYEFAKQAVKETQLVYNKGNRPEWARGTIGALAFTFKTYSISYVELLQRMAASGPEGRRAALLMVGVLFIMAGAGGLPGVEDAEDVVDGIAQRVFGLNFQTRQKRQEWLADIFGEGGARFIENGLSGLPWSPTDVSGRLGLGNLIPGTGLFVKKENYGRDVAEIAGPAADMTKRFLEGAGLLLQGEFLKAGEIVSPTAVRNMIQGGRMLATDQYTDTKGRKVIDTTPAEGITKLIGFQPADVARVQEATGTMQRMIALNKIRESEIADKWAKGLASGDAEQVQEARDELRKWNESNPESPIRINMPQLFRRVRALKEDKATRIARTAPKEIRQDVRRALEQGQ